MSLVSAFTDKDSILSFLQSMPISSRKLGCAAFKSVFVLPQISAQSQTMEAFSGKFNQVGRVQL
jgi:hypothetical protein